MNTRILVRTIAIAAGLMLVWLLLGWVDLDQSAILGIIYNTGGRWVLLLATIAAGVFAGLRLDRAYEASLKRKRAEPINTSPEKYRP